MPNEDIKSYHIIPVVSVLVMCFSSLFSTVNYCPFGLLLVP